MKKYNYNYSFFNYFLPLIVVLFCVTGGSINKVPQEHVLNKNQWVRFKNPVGDGLIEYVSSNKRHFHFNSGVDRTIKMTIREKRFQGKLGLYYAGNRWFFEVWKPDDRIVAEEAQLYFESLQEALEFLKQGSAISEWVWNEQGYVVGYWVSAQRKQVNISLYRFYLGEQPLTDLPECPNGTVMVSAEP